MNKHDTIHKLPSQNSMQQMLIFSAKLRAKLIPISFSHYKIVIVTYVTL